MSLLSQFKNLKKKKKPFIWTRNIVPVSKQKIFKRASSICTEQAVKAGFGEVTINWSMTQSSPLTAQLPCALLTSLSSHVLSKRKVPYKWFHKICLHYSFQPFFSFWKQFHLHSKFFWVSKGSFISLPPLKRKGMENIRGSSILSKTRVKQRNDQMRDSLVEWPERSLSFS